MLVAIAHKSSRGGFAALPCYHSLVLTLFLGVGVALEQFRARPSTRCNRTERMRRQEMRPG